MIKQSLALSWINLKSFPIRFVSALVSILSIACVSAVLLSVLVLTDGMNKTMQRTGLEQTIIVMRAGAISELQSVLFSGEINLLANHQFMVRHNDNRPMQSAEMYVNAEYKRGENHSAIGIKDGNKSVDSLALRGVSADTYHFRPNFKIEEGETFQSGLREIIIGRAIARRMPELKVGRTIMLGSSQWRISGVFSDNNSVFESEVWADLATVQSDYQRGNSIQSLRLALKTGSDLAALEKEWSDDPRINVKVIKEKDYFSEQAENLTRLIRWVGLPVAFIMALGATIAALNTMYVIVSNRSQEIATHKAIGFGPLPIAASIISEALLISIVGGLAGVLPLYVLFDGWTTATNDAANLSQMMFNFDVTIGLMSLAMLLSLFIGLLGGILPAVKAIRLPVSLALKEI